MKRFRDLNRLQKTGIVATEIVVGFLAVVNCGGSSSSAEGFPTCKYITIHKDLGRNAIDVVAVVDENSGTADSVTYSFGDGTPDDTEAVGAPAHHSYSKRAVGDVTVGATLNVDFGDGPVHLGPGNPDTCSSTLTLPLTRHQN